VQGPDQVHPCDRVVSKEQAVNLQRVTWGGGPAPLPMGTWYADGTVVGDATGGVMIVSVKFNLPNQNLDSVIYNLEQFDMFVLGTGGNILVEILGWRIDPRNPLGSNTGWKRTIPTTASQGTDGFLLMTAEQDIQSTLPVLFGSQGQVAQGSQLNLEKTNVNLDSLGIWAMGYMWDSGARSFPGGPRRPEGVVFG